jgi:hypothetical protein
MPNIKLGCTAFKTERNQPAELTFELEYKIDWLLFYIIYGMFLVLDNQNGELLTDMVKKMYSAEVVDSMTFN